MTDPLDPLRRAQPVRRTARDRKARTTDDTAETANLPAVIEGEEVVAPPPLPTHEAPAAFAAQLLGQSGEKRGLRGGPPVIDAARQAYVQAEWSGPSDRRTGKGRTTRKEI